jgi:hypothetical protein
VEAACNEGWFDEVVLDQIRLYRDDRVVLPRRMRDAAAGGARAAPVRPGRRARDGRSGVPIATLARVHRASSPRKASCTDPTLDAESGQQTAATTRLDAKVAAHLASRHKQFEVLPFRSASLSKAEYLLTSTMARETHDRHAGVAHHAGAR